MKRALIIIGNQGGERNFLPGVSKDLRSYVDFFVSDYGGAWEQDEIHIDMYWTIVEVKHMIEKLLHDGCEYFIVIFSGHGFTSKSKIYLDLGNNQDLPIISLQEWLRPAKSLIITDSCRSVVSSFECACVSHQSMTLCYGMVSPRLKYRHLYNSEINRLERGHNTIVTSSDYKEDADDTDSGGLYSSTLINHSWSLIGKSRNKIYDIRHVHEWTANKVILLSDETQHPQIYSTSLITPPFVVC